MAKKRKKAKKKKVAKKKAKKRKKAKKKKAKKKRKRQRNDLAQSPSPLHIRSFGGPAASYTKNGRFRHAGGTFRFIYIWAQEPILWPAWISFQNENPPECKFLHKLSKQRGYIPLIVFLQSGSDFLYCLQQIFVISEDERITIWIILITKTVNCLLKTQILKEQPLSSAHRSISTARPPSRTICKKLKRPIALLHQPFAIPLRLAAT